MSTTERIVRKPYERRTYVDGCSMCQHIKDDCDGFGPSHDASYGCESGKRDHCTCDFCF